MLITIKEANDITGKSRDYLSVVASTYRKEYGKYPKWFIKYNKKAMIDFKEYERQSTVSHRASLYATTKLYWCLQAIGMSDSDICRMLSERSVYFKSVMSWQSFIASELFASSMTNKISSRPSLLFEFVKISTKYLYLLKKSGKLDFKMLDKTNDVFN